MRLRKAKMKDIPEIHKIINFYAKKGLLLPRSLSELYEHIRDYFVIEENGIICATCALGICWEDLAEIKSLAVLEERQKRGYGKMLVNACIDEANELGIRRIFTLTYVPEFFFQFGFKEIEKTLLPHKIWADCLKCPKFPECDETAMNLDLKEG